LRFQIGVTRIQHDHPDSDLVLLAMGCAASLLAKRLSRTPITAPSSAVISLMYESHKKVNMPEYGGEVVVSEISAVCSPDIRPTTFYHINPVDAESRGTLSWDGRIPTHPQGVLEIIVRNFLSQRVVRR
jgi:hypothetical protein